MQSHNILNFDRFNVHTIDKEKLAAEILQTEDQIKAGEEAAAKGVGAIVSEILFLPEYAFEYQQLAIAYAFARRNQKSAHENAVKNRLSRSKDTLEYGIACNLLGNASFMTGGDSNPLYFNEALAVFEKLESQITDAAAKVILKINQGFAHRYIGLASHRISMRNEKDLEISNEAHEDSLKNYHAAQENFAEAIKIQNETSASAFPIELDLMETVHLIGVRNTKQKAYQAAIAFLLEAIKMEKDFNTTTGAIHFLTYISMQSLGEAYLLNNENENALKILNETLEAQIAFYAKREHTDIAKTLHFVGMAHHNQKEYLLALTALHEALDIKEKLLKANDFMITVTENELIKAYNGDFDFDWNNSLTIESNRQKISRLEDFLKRIDSKRQLNSEDALAYGQLCYKLGTFHVQAHFAEVKEAAEHARSQSKPAEVSALTSFPGTLYGRTQSPRVADFAGTSVAMPLVNNSATPTPTPEEMLSVSTISGLTNTL